MSTHKSLAELAERVWNAVPEARPKGDSWTLNKHMRCESTYEGAEFPHPDPEASIEAACVRWLVEHNCRPVISNVKFLRENGTVYTVRIQSNAIWSGCPGDFPFDAPTLTEALLLAVEAVGEKA